MGTLLDMRGIVRRFGELVANDGIDLDVAEGEIVGLLGENGSGKSTLMKVLFGMLPPDSGTITFRGRPLAGHTPADAMAAGIAMIHQHFMLVDAMTVTESVMLGWPAAGRKPRQWLQSRSPSRRDREASSAAREPGLDRLRPDLDRVAAPRRRQARL